MSLLEKSEREQQRERRVAALRALCQGEGIVVDVAEGGDTAGAQALCEAIGPMPLDEFWKLFARFDGLLPGDNIFLDAFLNALIGGKEGSNLTTRRQEFLEKHDNISARTLMRYEIEGAEIFVRHIEMAEDMLRREQEVAEDDESARDIDIAVLRQRMSKLEARMAELESKLSSES